jgi:hypothetical protein
MILFLVEEHTLGYGGGGPETVSWHQLVQIQGQRDVTQETRTYQAREAFIQGCKREGATQFYAPEELEEVVPGYLWQAADGSSVANEVRFLGKIEMDCYRGKVDII